MTDRPWTLHDHKRREMRKVFWTIAGWLAVGLGIWAWQVHSNQVERKTEWSFYVKCYAAAPQFRSFDSDACDELWAAAGHDNSGYSTGHDDIGFSGYSSDEE